MKNLYIGLKERVAAECPSFKYVGMWNNQVADITDKDGQKAYSFGLPAVFFEFANDNPVDSVGGGVQLYDPLDIRAHIIDDFYDAQDGTMEVNLRVMDLEAELHAALQLFWVKGADFGSGPLSHVGQERDYDHGNVYHSVPIYRTTWVDNTQSQPIGGYDIDPPLTLDLTAKFSGPATISVIPDVIAFDDTIVGEFSSAIPFTVIGTNLTSDITITSIPGFPINLDGGDQDDSPLTVPAGSIVYVRFAPIDGIEYAGAISVASAGVDTVYVNVSGQGVMIPDFGYKVTLSVADPGPGIAAGERNGFDIGNGVLFAYNWNPGAYPSPFVSNEAYITYDGETFTQIANAPDKGDHAFGGFKDADTPNIYWIVGSQNLTPGKLFVHTFNTDTLAWTRISNDVELNYANLAYILDGWIYVGVTDTDDTSRTYLYKSATGLNGSFELVSEITPPVGTLQNCVAYTHGSKARYGLGGNFIGGVATDFCPYIFEVDASDPTARIIVLTAPSEVWGLWGTAKPWRGLEFIITGQTDGPSDPNFDKQGAIFYRSRYDSVLKSIECYDQLATKHQLAAPILNNNTWLVGFGSRVDQNSIYKVTPLAEKESYLLRSFFDLGNDSSASVEGVRSIGAKLIVVSITFYKAGPVPVFWDEIGGSPSGNTWIQGTRVDGATAASTIIYYCINPNVGASHEFQVDTALGYPSIVVDMYNLADGAEFEFDSQVTAVSGPGSSLNTGTITPSTANNLIVTCANYWTANSGSIDNGFTITAIIDPTPNTLAGATAYKINQSGPVNPVWSWVGANNETAISTLCFKIV